MYEEIAQHNRRQERERKDIGEAAAICRHPAWQHVQREIRFERYAGTGQFSAERDKIPDVSPVIRKREEGALPGRRQLRNIAKVVAIFNVSSI